MLKATCPKTMEYLEKVNEANQNHPLIDVVAQLLQATVDANERACRPAVSQLSMFESAQPAPISVNSFVKRLMKYGGISPSCLLAGMMYLERLKPNVPNVWLTTRNVQKLYLTAVMTAAKFEEDFYFSNGRWAEIGGIKTKELNKLELQFLKLTNFKLIISPLDYEQMVKAVMAWRPVVSQPYVGSPAATNSTGNQYYVNDLAGRFANAKLHMVNNNSYTDVSQATTAMLSSPRHSASFRW